MKHVIFGALCGPYGLAVAMFLGSKFQLMAVWYLFVALLGIAASVIYERYIMNYKD